MSEVNKIVTIEQLKKAIQDYFKNITKEKILDNYLTDDNINELYNEHLMTVGNSVGNLEETLKELNDKGWLDDKLKPSEKIPEDDLDGSEKTENESDDSSDEENDDSSGEENDDSSDEESKEDGVPKGNDDSSDEENKEGSDQEESEADASDDTETKSELEE